MISSFVPNARTHRENISRSTDMQDAVKGWMNSPGHKAALLDPNNTHIGVGIILYEMSAFPVYIIVQQFIKL